MKFLVTGGAGFIGSNIALTLVEQGHNVRVLDNLASGFRQNLKSVADKIEFIEGDITNLDTVTKAVSGMDYVLHQAALPSVPRSVKDPISSNEVNITGTLYLLQASKESGVKKFVMASSSSIYGESEELPKHEQMEPSPLSPYAVTKLTGEYYCKIFWELYRFPTVALRYFNIFGPNQDPGSEYSAVVPKFITSLLKGESPVIYGDGGQSRDFTYIDNCVQANILAATDEKIVGDNFNVACGSQFTLNQLVDELKKIMDVKVNTIYEDERVGDIRHSYASIDKFKQAGYSPYVSFEEGLRKTIDFYRDND